MNFRKDQSAGAQYLDLTNILKKTIKVSINVYYSVPNKLHIWKWNCLNLQRLQRDIQFQRKPD